jgi:hypothetical protein
MRTAAWMQSAEGDRSRLRLAGPIGSESILASPVTVRAPKRSAFRGALRSSAQWTHGMMTSCPSSLSNRLPHGDRIPAPVRFGPLGIRRNISIMGLWAVACQASHPAGEPAFSSRLSLRKQGCEITRYLSCRSDRLAGLCFERILADSQPSSLLPCPHGSEQVQSIVRFSETSSSILRLVNPTFRN